MSPIVRHVLLAALHLAVSAGITPLFAQQAETPAQTLRTPKYRSQLIGGVDARLTQLHGTTALMTGGRLGVLINRHTTIALAARANVNPNINTEYTLPNGREAGLAVGYGGLEVGRWYRPLRAVHLATSVLLGGGLTSHHDRGGRDGENNDLPLDGFFVAEPELQVQANVTSFMRVALGGSYRVVQGVKLAKVSDSDLRGVSGSLTFTFGRF